MREAIPSTAAELVASSREEFEDASSEFSRSVQIVSRPSDQNPNTIPGHNWCTGGGPESQPDQTSALR